MLGLRLLDQNRGASHFKLGCHLRELGCEEPQLFRGRRIDWQYGGPFEAAHSH